MSFVRMDELGIGECLAAALSSVGYLRWSKDDVVVVRQGRTDMDGFRIYWKSPRKKSHSFVFIIRHSSSLLR